MRKLKDPFLFQHIKLFLTEYLPKVRAKSNNTVVSYKDTINLYLLFLKESEHIPLEHITSDHFNATNIIAFLQWLKNARNNSTSSCNLRLSGLRHFCKYLMSEMLISYDTYIKICCIEKQKVCNYSNIEILTVAQMRGLLELPCRTSKIGLRDWFYMALLYDSGCRNQEILNLRLKDIRSIDSGGGNLAITGKGNKFRINPISTEVMRIFRNYKSVFHPKNNPEDYLFYTVRNGTKTPMSADNVARFMNQYEKILRKEFPTIPHLHPHLFRHTRAMHLYQAGMPLALVGEWLGHSQLETTLIYAHADTEMKRKAIEKISSAENSVFSNENFIFVDETEYSDKTLKQLYGLA